MNYTSTQQKIIGCNSKILLASAKPGAGKSTVLVARGKRLWDDEKEPILICTFSNKAVADIVKKIPIEYNKGIRIQTIHSLCYSIIKDHWGTLKGVIGGPDWPKEPILATKTQEIELLEEFYPGKDSEKLFELFETLRKFTCGHATVLRMYKQGVYFGKYTQQDVEMWDRYESHRLAKGFISFNDMVYLAAMIMPIPEVSIPVSKQYAHVLIDEAQDTSESQWTVLRPLVAHAKTTLIVYDKNQMIFSWAGADLSAINGLGYLQDAVMFSMNESFRSTKSIVGFANKVVKDKTSQIVSSKQGQNVSFKEYTTRAEEINSVLSSVNSNTAIISRTNYYLESYERECIKRGISYQGTGFYRSKHIKELYHFILTLKDVDSITDIVNQAFLENSTYTKIEKEDFKLVFKVIEKESLKGFTDLVNKSLSMNKEGVTLITGHGSKGLEWPSVYVVGAHEGHMPHRLNKDIEEENNLFYVCVTRAMNNLTVSWVGDKPSQFIPETCYKK